MKSKSTKKTNKSSRNRLLKKILLGSLLLGLTSGVGYMGYRGYRTGMGMRKQYKRFKSIENKYKDFVYNFS